jgi:hypothetical protein
MSQATASNGELRRGDGAGKSPRQDRLLTGGTSPIGGFVDMSDDDLHEGISRLESEIEEFAEALERCRKITLISKVAITAGALLVGATTLGLTSFDPLIMIFAISAILGGTVLFGSNTSTKRQIELAMKSAEAALNALIDKIELRVVNDS